MGAKARVAPLILSLAHLKLPYNQQRKQNATLICISLINVAEFIIYSLLQQI